jgi:hypothetical protein
MVVDAERKKELLADLNEGALGTVQDPEIRALRRPEHGCGVTHSTKPRRLSNVLLGDMSLVGSRPALPAETAEYALHMLRRLAVKPGITGLWQVSGRGDLPIEDSVRLDVRYVENWSLLLDLQIMWKTGRAVVSASGAY